MEQLRVPQRQVEVTLRLDSGRQLRGRLFVTDVAAGGGRAYTLLDRLNESGDRFVPFEGDERTVVACASILYLVYERRPDAEELEVEEADASPSVAITLRDGSELSGEVRFNMPPDRRRLLDFLNAAPAFFALSKGDRRWLVNRDAIQEIREVG